MPKDKNKDTSIRGFGLTAKEAEDRTKDLATAADYPEHGAEEEKAKPQDESEIICYYYTGEEPHHCPGPMGDERHYVIKNGNMVMAHRRCHKRDQDGEKKTPNVIIR